MGRMKSENTPQKKIYIDISTKNQISSIMFIPRYCCYNLIHVSSIFFLLIQIVTSFTFGPVTIQTSSLPMITTNHYPTATSSTTTTTTFLLEKKISLNHHNRATSAPTTTTTSLQMGMFDAFSKAFTNESYQGPPEGIKATARHILVKGRGDVDSVVKELATSSTFAEVARKYSTCPSKSQGGSLGSFGPGTMVKEFDDVIFNPKTKIGEIVGPISTQFGYHMIVVDKRTGV